MARDVPPFVIGDKARLDHVRKIAYSVCGFVLPCFSLLFSDSISIMTGVESADR